MTVTTFCATVHMHGSQVVGMTTAANCGILNQECQCLSVTTQFYIMIPSDQPIEAMLEIEPKIIHISRHMLVIRPLEALLIYSYQQ